MTTTESRPLETGWLPDTPIGDTLFRRFVHNQGDHNAVVALAAGGRAGRTDHVLLADAAGPVPYFNQAVLTRPLAGIDDPVLDDVDAFFAASASPATLLSLWPGPGDLSGRGWELVGHPTLVVRGPGGVEVGSRPGVGVRRATSDELTVAERIAVDGYPLEEARGAPAGTVFPPGLAGRSLTIRLGTLDGEPVAIGNVYVAHGVVNLALGVTLPAARRRGVWEALVSARVAEAPDLPAVAITSDLSRPGFDRMGFVPVTRLTLWARQW